MMSGFMIPENKLMFLRAGIKEIKLHKAIKDHGSIWDREKQIRSLSNKDVKELGIEDRVL